MGIALCGVEKIHENVDVPIFVDISRNNHIWTDGMRGMASAMLKERQCIVCNRDPPRARHSFVCFQQKQNCLEWRRTSQSHRLASNRTQIPETEHYISVLGFLSIMTTL